MNGRKPCLVMSRKLVRRPTPAKVSKCAHLERLPSVATCPLLNAGKLTSTENKEETQDELGELPPQKRGLVANGFGLPCSFFKGNQLSVAVFPAYQDTFFRMSNLTARASPSAAITAQVSKRKRGAIVGSSSNGLVR